MRRGGERRPLSSSGPEQSNDKERGSIFRVRADLREKNAKAFTPSGVSLGPLHYPEFKHLKLEKEKYVEVFKAKAKLDSAEALSTISFCVPKIKDYYEEELNYDNREFIEMMFVDGCLILECMRRKVDEDASIVVSRRLSDDDVWKDIILIENQVPALVLEKIYDLTELSGIDRTRTFLHFAMEYFSYYNPQNVKPEDVCVPIAHMVGLLRFLLVSPSFRDGSEARNINLPGNVPSARQVEKSGIDIKLSSKNEIVITRHNWRLEMPELKMDGSTSAYLNNILAYEETHYKKEEYVHDYVYIIKCLVQTEFDADILKKARVILTTLSGKEVYKCFKNMPLNMNGIREKYRVMLLGLTGHEEDPDNECKGKFRRICCPDLPRTILSVALFSGVCVLIYRFFKAGGGDRLAGLRI